MPASTAASSPTSSASTTSTEGGFDTYVERGGQISFLDPMVVLPIMARATTRLGLGATLSTTLFNAYHLARSLLSLDVLSKGRASPGTS